MTKQYKVTLCYDLLGTHSVGTKVTVSDSTRWFGHKLCGTWFAPSRICFNEIGTDLHVLNGCRYQNMNRLTRWCHFPLFFFLVTPFFCVKPRCLGMIKWQNNTKSHYVTTCLVHTPCVQRLLFRVDWSQGTFTHSLYIDLWWRCPSPTRRTALKCHGVMSRQLYQCMNCMREYATVHAALSHQGQTNRTLSIFASISGNHTQTNLFCTWT